VIRLTAILKRNPALSREEFLAHWRDVHAAKILSVPGIERWLVRYEQHERVDAAAAGVPWTGTDGYDGVTLQWFRSMDDFYAMIGDAGYRRIVGPDEAELLDLGATIALLTEEDRLIVDGRVPSGGDPEGAP
jgi:hypothetical protein